MEVINELHSQCYLFIDYEINFYNIFQILIKISIQDSIINLLNADKDFIILPD
jgi:hypothetical protein